MMQKTTVATIDSYIKTFPAPIQSKLQQVYDYQKSSTKRYTNNKIQYANLCLKQKSYTFCRLSKAYLTVSRACSYLTFSQRTSHL